MGKQNSQRIAPGIVLQADGTVRAWVPLSAGSRSNDSATFASAAEAKRWRAACAEARACGKPNPPPDHFQVAKPGNAMTVITVAALVNIFLAVYEAERTRVTGRTYLSRVATITRYILNAEWAERDAETLTTADARAVSTWLGGLGRAKKYAQYILWNYSQIFAFGVAEGLVSKNPFDGAIALEPVLTIDPEAVPGRSLEYWDLPRTKILADSLDLLSRLALWIQRLCGLRIGEVFGLRLGDFDFFNGVVHIHAQGGKRYIEHDPAGGFRRVNRIDRTKTKAGTRCAAMPPSLLAAVCRHVQDVYGVDPRDGDFDPNAPLMVRRADAAPNQHVYFSALKAARIRLHMTVAEIGYSVTGHFFRKLLNTDLKKCPGLSEVDRNTLVGHDALEPGNTKVNRDTYTIGEELDPTAALLAANFMETKIVAVFGEGPEFVYAAPRLLIDFHAYTVAEAAQYLGHAQAHVRQLILRGELEAVLAERVRGRPVTVLRAADVHEYKDRRDNIWTPGRVADELGVPADIVVHWCANRQVKCTKTPYGRWRLNEASVRERTHRWHDERRTRKHLSLTDAAARLSSTIPGVEQMVEDGLLEVGGIDSVGRTRVTRDSVERVRAEAIARDPRRRRG